MESTQTMNDRSPADIAATAGSVTTTARNAARRIAAHGRGMAHEFGELATELGTQARKREQRVRAAVGAQTKSAVALVREKPLVGVGMALAAAVVLCGTLLRRR
jgi:ElaB/YqjD/DUF883 family membrane-anchored ribosome-binding protein